MLIAPGSAGVTVAKRIMDGIANLEAVDDHTISVSAGVARFPHDGKDATALLEAARAAVAASSGRAAIVEAGK